MPPPSMAVASASASAAFLFLLLFFFFAISSCTSSIALTSSSSSHGSDSSSSSSGALLLPGSASHRRSHHRSSSSSSSSSVVISSDSILVSLLDSPYTELAELADQASLLQALEQTVSSRSITILAPRNSFLDRDLDPDFRRFLQEPGNVESLRELLRMHVIPRRINAQEWSNRTVETMAGQAVEMTVSRSDGKNKANLLRADLSNVVAPDAIERRDGVVHGIDRLLIPRSVQKAYNAWKGAAMGEEGGSKMLAELPQESPTPGSFAQAVAARRRKALETEAQLKARAYAPPEGTIYAALAPAPSLAPAPAPGPSSGHRWFDGHSHVADFISTLVRYGGYNEMADLLVNLTSLAPELGKLVSEGYRMTILAPNDEAMKELAMDELAETGAPEHIIFYHIIPEYQTEESFYNAVRRFGRVSYQTLREGMKLVAQEEDGTVVFGEGKDNKAHLIDIDIFKDGRISVQGIDKVLSPPNTNSTTTTTTTTTTNRRKLDQNNDPSPTTLPGWLCWLLSSSPYCH